MTLILSPDQETAILAHAERDYPGECCGVLIGDIVGLGNYVSLVIPIDNKHEDGPDRRFRMSGDDLLNVEKIARNQKQTIVGFYHSHPDVPAVPSQYDRDHAWDTYSYLIVELSSGTAKAGRSWRLDLDEGRFNEENVLVNSCILEAAAEAQINKEDR